MRDQQKLFICIGLVTLFAVVRARRKALEKHPLITSLTLRKKRSPPCIDGKRRRLLLIATGSVASVKIPTIVQQLVQKEVFVDLVLTEASYKFLKQVEYNGFKGLELLKSISILRSVDGTPFLELFRDKHEWESYSEIGDAVLHIDLVKRNNVLLVAPLSADSLAKFALGFATNLATSVMRAWYYDLEESFTLPIAEKYGKHVVNKAVLVAPAMNTFMYYQQVTRQHLSVLEKRMVKILPPVSKTLACGDTGVGAMADVTNIVQAAVEELDNYESACLDAEQKGFPQFTP